jgi:hypothetical protein
MTIAGIGMPFLTDEEVLRIGACGLSLAGGREHVEPNGCFHWGSVCHDIGSFATSCPQGWGHYN